MSDFLSNLVERSVAATVAVRPKLHSVFEPPAAGGGTFFRGSETPHFPPVEQYHQEPVDQISRSKSPERSTPFEPVARFATGLSSVSGADLTSHESTELPHPAPTVQPRSDRPAQHQREPRSSTPPDIAGSVGPDSEDVSNGALRHALSRIRPRVEVPGKREAPATSSKRRGIVEASRTVEEAGAFGSPLLPAYPTARRTTEPGPRDSGGDGSQEPQATNIIELMDRERGTHRESALVRNLHAVLPRPPSSRPLDVARQTQNPKAAPAINVTIGRIEVRATRPPPARPQSAPAPAPIMSLDEYLRQRAGGDRR